MSKCPGVARGGGGWGWALLELTDALLVSCILDKFVKMADINNVRKNPSVLVSQKKRQMSNSRLEE